MNERLEQCVKQNKWEIEKLEKSVAEYKKNLAEELRKAADRIEKAEAALYQPEMSSINSYIELIENAQTDLIAAYQHRTTLKYIFGK
ncbi:MAG: hypothetical protein J6M62_04510 [Selenomonadaceae bacterium]|nr:hypothetical protein [Selenomonadaceae bacterium]MBP3722299.1 hypothetical protein [Selenomonadaceae bacterium]